MKPLPKNKIKEIARDIHRGLIFTDRHIKTEDERLLGGVFTILSLMDNKGREKMMKDPPGMVYEYLSKALPRGVNGYPCFMSMNRLSVDDAVKVFELIKKLEKSEKEILGPA